MINRETEAKRLSTVYGGTWVWLTNAVSRRKERMERNEPPYYVPTGGDYAEDIVARLDKAGRRCVVADMAFDSEGEYIKPPRMIGAVAIYEQKKDQTLGEN